MNKLYTFFSIFLCCTCIYGQNFTLTDPQPSFVAVSDGTTHLVDVDGDNDLDYFSAGWDGSNRTAQLYLNNGGGAFTLVDNTPFTGVSGPSAEFGDVDKDGDLDLILTGYNDPKGRIAEMYLNNGSGTYALAEGTLPFVGVNDGDVTIVDLDGDGDLDVTISGHSTADGRVAEVYKNDGTGGFTKLASSTFLAFKEGDVDFADVDGDGDLDLLATGDDGSDPVESTKLFINDGTGGFTEDATASALFTDLKDSDADFADVDGDGDQDLLINGRFGNSDRVAELYLNDGTGRFTLGASQPFIGGNAGTVDFFDADNDGDMDVLISGFENNSPSRNTRLYGNDGNGNFKAQTSETFTGVNNSDIAVGDVNGDGYKDIIITGYSSKRIAELYVNSGDPLTVDATQKLENALRVFPNPATDVLTIQSNRGVAAKRIQLFNMLGQVVANANANNTDIEIDVSSLHPGIYLLNIASGNESMVKKVIKE
jgi:hypothetical protein